jgi:hypothetical protein
MSVPPVRRRSRSIVVHRARAIIVRAPLRR